MDAQKRKILQTSPLQQVFLPKLSKTMAATLAKGTLTSEHIQQFKSDIR